MQGTFQSWKTWNTFGITIYKLYFTHMESYAIWLAAMDSMKNYPKLGYSEGQN